MIAYVAGGVFVAGDARVRRRRRVCHRRDRWHNVCVNVVCVAGAAAWKCVVGGADRVGCVGCPDAPVHFNVAGAAGAAAAATACIVLRNCRSAVPRPSAASPPHACACVPPHTRYVYNGCHSHDRRLCCSCCYGGRMCRRYDRCHCMRCRGRTRPRGVMCTRVGRRRGRFRSLCCRCCRRCRRNPSRLWRDGRRYDLRHA